jgi:hypothetical protein
MCHIWSNEFICYSHLNFIGRCRKRQVTKADRWITSRIESGQQINVLTMAWTCYDASIRIHPSMHSRVRSMARYTAWGCGEGVSSNRVIVEARSRMRDLSMSWLLHPYQAPLQSLSKSDLWNALSTFTLTLSIEDRYLPSAWILYWNPRGIAQGEGEGIYASQSILP